MPTYKYKREDGTTFEQWQGINEDALETCPTTGQKVERVISGGGGVVFKGDGFYETDYKNKNSNNGDTDGKPENSESGSDEDSKMSEPNDSKQDH